MGTVSLYTDGRMTTCMSCVCACELVHACIWVKSSLSCAHCMCWRSSDTSLGWGEEIRGSHVLSTSAEVELECRMKYSKSTHLETILYSIVSRWGTEKKNYVTRDVTNESLPIHYASKLLNNHNVVNNNCVVCLFLTLSTNHPAEEPLLLWPMVIFLILPKLGASKVNLSSVPFSKLFLSLSSRLSPEIQQFIHFISWTENNYLIAYTKNPVTLLVTSVSKFSKYVDEDICICSAPFNIRSEDTHYIFIIWKIRRKNLKLNLVNKLHKTLIK